MLDFTTSQDLGSPFKRLIVYMHGLGGSNKWGSPFQHLKDTLVVCPNGPISLGKDSFAWYWQIQDNHVNSRLLKRSMNAIFALINHLITDETEEIVVSGFSQGGTMALCLPHYAQYGHNGPTPIIDKSIVFAGYVPVHILEDMGHNTTEHLWLHGIEDRENHYSWFLNQWPYMQRVGIDVTTRVYPCGHTIAPKMAIDAKEWLE